MITSRKGFPFYVRILFALIALAMCSVARAEEPLLVGLLEEIPPSFVGDNFKRAVRVAFQHTHDGWQAFPSDCWDSECLSRPIRMAAGEIPRCNG